MLCSNLQFRYVFILNVCGLKNDTACISSVGCEYFIKKTGGSQACRFQVFKVRFFRSLYQESPLNTLDSDVGSRVPLNDMRWLLKLGITSAEHTAEP